MNKTFSLVLAGSLFLSRSGFGFGTEDLKKIHLPQGFSITILTDQVPGARSMTLGALGTLFVGTKEAGKIYSVTPQGKVSTFAENLNVPNGVAFREGALYVAENDRIIKFEGAEEQKAHKFTVVKDGFPKDRHHGWKYLAFSPDGWLYVPVGAPCNVCEKQNEVYASIMKLKPDGSQLQVYAKGIRNTVGFDWDPLTKDLWFTENGRDWLGDDLPPDELNHATAPGQHFGFPYCYGISGKDPQFGQGKDCGVYSKPAVEFEAHVATLGMKFYTGRLFPDAYRNQIFVAEHGSWNRTVRQGYRIALVKRKPSGEAEKSVFADGWLQGGQVLGRPVDIAVSPEGNILVSDDYNGIIYKISYVK